MPAHSAMKRCIIEVATSLLLSCVGFLYIFNTYGTALMQHYTYVFIIRVYD